MDQLGLSIPHNLTLNYLTNYQTNKTFLLRPIKLSNQSASVLKKEKMDNFEIDKIIGRGGQGTVFTGILNNNLT
jgi:hypothetical protein